MICPLPPSGIYMLLVRVSKSKTYVKGKKIEIGMGNPRVPPPSLLNTARIRYSYITQNEPCLPD